MAKNTFKTIYNNLVPSKKLIGIGSILLAFSCFLPWYSDLDRFNTGNTFLGISGPLYLAGLIVFILASASLFVIIAEAIGHKLDKFPLNTQQIHISTVAVSILMLLLTFSVYFHPKFGINIANKQVGFGVYLAIISLGLMVAGIFYALKKKIDKQDLMERHHESLKSIGVEKKEENNIQTPKPHVLSKNIEDERFSYFSNEITLNNDKK